MNAFNCGISPAAGFADILIRLKGLLLESGRKPEAKQGAAETLDLYITAWSR